MKDFKKLIKEAHLGNPLNEDRKAIEYIKSISDPEEREAEMKRMFGDDELDEATDFNDPALIKARAAQMKRDEMDNEEAEYKAKQAALDKKYGSNFMDKLDAELDLKGELEDLEQEREMLMIDMEEEAEPEGGEIADRYGERLNQIDQRIADIQEELDDLRMYESVNEAKTESELKDAWREWNKKHPKDQIDWGEYREEHGEHLDEGRSMAQFSYADKGSPIKVGDTLYKDGKAGKVIQKLDWKNAFNVEFGDDTMIQVPFTSVEGDKIIREDRYLKNQDSYIRVTEPRFSKDKNNPNFLYGRINYDTGPGVGMALGKETMAGQIRRLSSMEAMRRMKAIAVQLEDAFDLEDIEVYDKENGVVELFAVSDDFIDMDPRSELSTAMLNEEFKVGDKVTYLGHPAVVTATEEYNGRDFVSVSYDKGNGATKARMILVKSGDVKAVKEGTCGYTPDGEPRSKPASPDLNEMEDEMLFMDRMYKDTAETSINLDDFKRTIKATYGKYA